MGLDQLKGLLPEVICLAEEAGRAIMRVYNGSFDVVRKGDGSPLTQADLNAHQLVSRGLSELTPEVPLLSEESSQDPTPGSSLYWLIDPLDGTREFVLRKGEFTVNIALIHKQKPILGVVHAPVDKITYSAFQGGGANKRVVGEPIQAIGTRILKRGRVKVVTSRSHPGPMLGRVINTLERELGPVEVVGMGSSLKLCLVAEGIVDFYPRLGPTSEWDTAAAQCVVEAAGGEVVDLSGRPLRYNKVSVQNPWFVARGDPGGDLPEVFRATGDEE